MSLAVLFDQTGEEFDDMITEVDAPKKIVESGQKTVPFNLVIHDESDAFSCWRAGAFSMGVQWELSDRASQFLRSTVAGQGQ